MASLQLSNEQVTHLEQARQQDALNIAQIGEQLENQQAELQVSFIH